MTSRMVAVCFSLAALALPAAAFAERGTQEQRDACTPDVFRLCGHLIPDADKIEACLRSAGPRLSPPCRVVFDPPSPPVTQTTPVRARRDRNQMLPPPAPDNHDDDD